MTWLLALFALVALWAAAGFFTLALLQIGKEDDDGTDE